MTARRHEETPQDIPVTVTLSIGEQQNTKSRASFRICATSGVWCPTCRFTARVAAAARVFTYEAWDLAALSAAFDPAVVTNVDGVVQSKTSRLIYEGHGTCGKSRY